MARAIALRRLRTVRHVSDFETPAPLISNGRLAVLILLGAEAMLFGGFIGAFLIYKLSAPFWPPPGLPRLPIAVTWANTMVLLGSAMTMKLAVEAAREGRRFHLRAWLLLTAALGTLFVSVQGSEWTRLEAHGLHLHSGNYGATFYVLIGLHALHVICAVLWLLGVTVAVVLARPGQDRRAAVEVCAIYWYFVCAVWPLLFGLVYF
ncbi:MAG TPA: cytochrome c oxidase subunit 3 [Candidatus Binataceae bacterium]|nr:cytochrome c oxidase subunit 3 [Candidatus Binataceae bacterium]